MAKPIDLTPNNVERISIRDKILIFDPESDPSFGLGAQVGGLGGTSAKAVSDAINQDGSINPDSLPDTLFDTSVNTLDDVLDGVAYAKVLAESLSAGLVLLSEVSGTLDDITDGETYAKVLLADLSGGHIILGNTVGDLDDIDDGTDYAKVLATDISAGHILLAEATGDIDDIADGASYGKVLLTDISSGHILLSETVGDLDDVADGTSYAKVASTSIDAGKIVVAGLDSGVTARMFSDSTTKANVEGWKHASDVTLIDGGDIYTGSITANKITVDSLSAISANIGTVTAGTINGCDIYANNFRFKRWTALYNLGSLDGWETGKANGDETITPYASNIILLHAADGAYRRATIQVGSYGIQLGVDNTSPLTFTKSPNLECVAHLSLSGHGSAHILIGEALATTNGTIGFYFIPGTTYAFYRSGGADTTYDVSIDNTLWHKYRIEITPNGSNVDIDWYVDDVSVHSLDDVDLGGATPGKNFGAKAVNDYEVGGDADSATLLIASAIFQQDY